jgi:hypothetical protein
VLLVLLVDMVLKWIGTVDENEVVVRFFATTGVRLVIVI